MSTPSPPYCRLDLAPPLADRFIFGVAPIDYGPVLLLMPFGFHLTMDTLPSGESLLRPTTHYCRLWIWRPSFERQRDFNPFHRKLRQPRCLRRRFDCYRVERTSSRGRDRAEARALCHTGQSHVSSGPPAIPEGRISRFRF